MRKGRLEAFSDGVMAVIITIMVLELHAPDEPTLSAVLHEAPKFFAYFLSFIYIAIYWNNHHHLFQLVKQVNGGILWANNGLLFCLSLVPFTTDWMGETRFASLPVAVYGVSLISPSIAYYVLERSLAAAQGSDSEFARTFGLDAKGIISTALYVAGTLLALIWPYASLAIFLAVALLWIVPDRRVEKRLKTYAGTNEGD